MGGIVKGISNVVGKVVGFIGKVFGLGMEVPPETSAYNDNLLSNKTDPTSFTDVVYGTRRKGGVRIGLFTKGEDNKFLYAIYALSHGEIQDISNPMIDGVPFSSYSIKNYVDWSYGLGADNQDATQDRLLQELGEPYWDLVNGKLQGVAYAVIKLTYDKDNMNSINNVTFDVIGKKVYNPITGLTAYSDNPALCALDYQTNKVYGRGMPYPQAFNVQSYIDAINYFDEQTSALPNAILGGGWFDSAAKTNGYFGVQETLFNQLISGEEYEVYDNSTGTPVLWFTDVLTSKSYTETPPIDFGNEDIDPGIGSSPYLQKFAYKIFFNKIKTASIPLFFGDAARNLRFKQKGKRYSCNGNLDTSQNLYDNLMALTTSFNGVITFVNGLSIIIPDRPEPIAMSFDSSNIVSDIDVEIPDSSSQLNEITGTWFDPENGYDQMTRTIKSDLFLQRDGGRPQSREINMPFCNNPNQVDRILNIELNKSRHAGMVKFDTFWKGLDLIVGNVISVTDEELLWDNKLFRVLKIGIPDATGDVSLTCVPYDASDYIEGFINARTPASYISIPIGREIPTVTGLSVSKVDDKIEYALRVQWTSPPTYEVDSYQLEIYQVVRDGLGEISSYSLFGKYKDITGSSYDVSASFGNGLEYEFRVYSVNDKNVRSITYTKTLYVYGVLQPPTDININIISPWAIEATPVYGSGNAGQVSLPHKWYLARHVDPVNDPEPTFADATLISSEVKLRWNGVRPNSTYRLWCSAYNSFESTDVAPGVLDTTDPANPVWTVGSGKLITTPVVTNDDIGVDVATLTLQSDAQVFSYKSDGTVTPSILNFTAYPKNIDIVADPLIFSTVPTVTLGGTGNTRTLAQADFDVLGVDSVTVTVKTTSESVSDSITIVKLIGGGADGVTPIVGYLTNEAHTIAADVNGNVIGNLADAGGIFKVFSGTTDVTTSSTFTLSSQTGLIASIGATSGSYTISAVTLDSGYVDLQATYNGVVIVKRYTISKSRKGDKGSDGLPGASGLSNRLDRAFADDAAGANASYPPVSDSTGKSYLGTNVVTWVAGTTEPPVSTNPLDYEWTLIKGSDGLPGANGYSNRVDFAYGDNSDGSGNTKFATGKLSTNNYVPPTPTTSTAYLGTNVITWVTGNTEPAVSTVLTDYEWTKTKGNDGNEGQRGAGTFTRTITGTAWSDAEALQAIVDVVGVGATPVVGDRVTLENLNTVSWYFSGYTETRQYTDSGTWVDFISKFKWGSIIDPTTPIIELGDLNDINPLRNSNLPLYDEAFEQGTERWSTNYTGKVVPEVSSPNINVIASAGSVGGNVLRIENDKWIYAKDAITVETNKKYRMKFRVRQTVDPTTTGLSKVYAGVACLDATYQQITQGAGTHRYFCVAGSLITVADGWQEFEGYIENEGDTHKNFKVGTAYIRPMFIVNYTGGNGTVEVDYISFERVTDQIELKDAGNWVTIPEDGANKFEVIDDPVEGRFTFKTDVLPITYYDVFSPTERAKLDNLRNNKLPLDSTKTLNYWGHLTSVPTPLGAVTNTDSIKNTDIVLNTDGTLVDLAKNINLGVVTPTGIGAETPTGAQTKADSARTTAINDIRSDFNSLSLSSGNLFANRDFSILAEDGRPVGCFAHFSSAVKSNIKYNTVEKCLELSSTTDTSIGCGFTAFKVNPNQRYKITVIAKCSNSNVSSGFYLRVNEYDNNLSSNAKYIASDAGETPYNLKTRYISFGAEYENVGLTTAYQVFEVIYTPTSTARWASPFVLNWFGLGTRALYISTLDIVPITGALALKDNLVKTDVTGTGLTPFDIGYTGDIDATKGASWGVDVVGVPTSLATVNSSDSIKNTDIVLNPDGTLFDNTAGVNLGVVTTTGIGAETPTGAQTKADNARTGALQDAINNPSTANNYTDGLVTTISRPVGGTFSSGNGTVGAIKIALPQYFTNTMIRFFVDVYDYSTQKSFTLEIGGYNYASSTSWINVFAHQTGFVGAEKKVRFGHDGTKCCIWLGDTTTSWSYPKVVIRDLTVSHSNYSKSQWESGWVLSLATAFNTVQTTLSPKSDQRYLPNVTTAGAGTALNVNPLSADDVGTTTTITIAAHTRQYGFGLVSLNAGSISGLAFSTKYYVYYDDPNYAGGAVSYQATTNLQDVVAGNHRIYVSSITTPADGGSGTTPPPEFCLTLDMLVDDSTKASQLTRGDKVDAWWGGEYSVIATVQQARLIEQKQVVYEIETSSGAVVQISESTPLELQNHRCITPKEVVVGKDKLAALKNKDKKLYWETVIRCEIIGEKQVMHISIGNGSFAAGLDADNRIITHNAQLKP